MNYKKIDLKKEIQELVKNNPGKQRGADVKSLKAYVLKTKGGEGIKAIEEELASRGFQLPDIEQISDMEWVPCSLPTIYMLAMAKVFDWDDKGVKDMGREIPTISTTQKMLIRYFGTLRMTLEIGAKRWNKLFTSGEAKIMECDTNNKKFVLRIENFKKHPIFCVYFAGTVSRLAELAIGKPVSAEETKCMFRGDPYHEYLFTW